MTHSTDRSDSMPALTGAGFDKEADGAVADPWGEAFALMVRTNWRSVDGTDPGDVQMRLTENGVQLRERTPCPVALTVSGHFAETCDNCWEFSSLKPSGQWSPVTNRIRVRVGGSSSSALGACRIEVQRRVTQGSVQPEAVWSEPWMLPDYSDTEFHKAHRDDRKVDTIWVSATPTGDVQVSTGHTFPTGILVRRATGSEDAPWTTPVFLPETYWEWADLLSDGSVQFRCWRPSSEESGYGNYRVEVRQLVGYKPTFAVEPTWGEYASSHGNHVCCTNGYVLELLTRGYPGSFHRSVRGVRVTDPRGVVRDILVVDREVKVASNLLVRASSQMSFSWRNGAYEPDGATIIWSMPEERMLRSREWTMLDSKVRARVARGRRQGVYVQILQDQPVRRHWWSARSRWVSDGVKPFNTAHDLTSDLRATFRSDQVAEVQNIASANLD